MELTKVEDYFPQGIAKGSAFLGRENEMTWLVGNIQSNHHTLILAPRRFGKTSLVINTLEKLKYPYACIDLHLALSINSIEKKLLKTIASLLKKISTKNDQLLRLVQRFFSLKNKKWTLGFKGIVGIELEPDLEDPLDNIVTAFELLDHVLGKRGLRAVIFIDEFQEIYSIDLGIQLQGAIRSFAQTSRNLVLIFSGSNRKILSHLFNDRSQPMYELCERIVLDRIQTSCYEKYINNVATKTWGKKLSDEAIDKIFQCSELHPKRVYNLCYYLWRLSINYKSSPSATNVENAWDFFIKQRAKDLRAALSNLSGGQLKVLTLIATQATQELTGKSAQAITKMAGSSIVKAMSNLEQEDYIEKNDSGVYRIIDPLITFFLMNYERENIEK
ncbi:MAG: ATP-binding protein [Legionellales bacterium]|nr:ATP-binding protein [Legionellales bacterium]